MTRFDQSILFLFALTLALLCCATLMLLFHRLWPAAGFVTLVGGAALFALLLPTGAALASLRWIAWRQPLTAWLTFDLVALFLAAAATVSLLR